MYTIYNHHVRIMVDLSHQTFGFGIVKTLFQHFLNIKLLLTINVLICYRTQEAIPVFR